MNDSSTRSQRENHRVVLSQRASTNATPDIKVWYYQSVALFLPATAAARNWMRKHCPAGNDHTYFAGALVVEPRYVESVLLHACRDGLFV